jgi:hypothetical protein
MNHPPARHDHSDAWLRWIVIFAVICIGVAVVRGVTHALMHAAGLALD